MGYSSDLIHVCLVPYDVNMITELGKNDDIMTKH